MRYFFSTGEASGELSATVLAQAIQRIDPDASFEGIGGDRMASAGFVLWQHHRGWSSMGLLQALGKAPKLLTIMWRDAYRLRARKFDLIVLVDFGAFNLRLASTLRRLHYAGPILYFFPPGAWLDNPRQAREVARTCVPLTPFKHQRDFYRSLGLRIEYFGHPLTGEYTLRPPPHTPAPDGGVVALLPGSRKGELRYNFPPLLGAAQELRKARPHLRVVVSAADAAAERFITRMLDRRRVLAEVVRGSRAALEVADAALITSGTAVLEAALMGVPCATLYVLPAVQAAQARKIYSGHFSIPNLILDEPAVAEFAQEEATPQNLAREAQRLLHEPRVQYEKFLPLRERLGPPDAVEQCAELAASLARSC